MAKSSGKIANRIVLDDRFELLEDAPRRGGMAEVHKARDLRGEDVVCAVKRMLPLPDEALLRESFNREYRGLELAQHRNVVRLIDFGFDADRRPYIAMEWLESDLSQLVQKKAPYSWLVFWRTIGKPLLEAICWAQTKKLVHRDIKPNNILVNDQGEPKLADYGISRVHADTDVDVLGGPTLRHHGTAPFTPPESDQGAYSFTRDGFSWAVVALCCLTGRTPAHYGDVADMLDGLEAGPVEILRQACHQDPTQRPLYAQLLLADLEQWMDTRQAEVRPSKIACHVQFSEECQFSLGRSFGPEVDDPVSAVLEDFAFIARVRSSSEEKDRIRVIGETWQLHAVRHSKRPGVLLIDRAMRIGSASAERQREATAETNLELRREAPPEPAQAEGTLDEVMALASYAELARAERRGTERERVHRIWNAYLRARSDYETGRGSAIRYTEARIAAPSITLTISSPPPPDLLGQDRLINVGGLSVALQVTAVLGDQVTLRVTFGDAARIPSQGVLEVNSRRALSAIEKQRKALDDLAYDRSVHPELAEIIFEAKGARPPLSNAPFARPREKFDDDKVDVLRKALGVQDVLVVEGPPGTGKTRLIEEIISQWLDAHPDHRLLLSSQTHAALDNVLERLAKRNSALDLVRVGRFDNERIAPSAAEFLLERKAQAWAERVRKAARPWLARRAAEHGVDAQELSAGALTVKLAAIIRDRDQTRKAREAAETLAKETKAEARTVELTNTEAPVELRQRTETALVDAGVFAERLASLEHEEAATRAALSVLPNIGRELATSENAEELEEYAAVLLGDGEAQRQHLVLMRLQEEWLERVGRSADFHSAMLASAKVVASTCVALAGVRGVNEVAFDLCIVDEASKATATEVLIPMTRSRRSILVGDPKQLPPFFERQILRSDALAEFSEEEIKENVFDRLLRTLPEGSRAKLRHQYRMVRPIGDLVSSVFYKGALVSPIESPEISFPQFSKAVTWLDTSAIIGGEPERRIGTSWRSPLECRVIRKTLEQLDFVAKSRKARYDVAVIAGYSAQVRAIEEVVRDYRATWQGLVVRINTVDAFQGSEADVCIYSVVRSNDRGDAGFLSEPPRLNVALSRARSLLLIVGDHVFCRGLPSAHPMSKVVGYVDGHSDDCEVRTLNDA
jgi:serine/threonine protein kinase